MDAQDIKVGQKWRHKLVPKLIAQIVTNNGESVRLRPVPRGFWCWKTYEDLLKHWEPVDAST